MQNNQLRDYLEARFKILLNGARILTQGVLPLPDAVKYYGNEVGMNAGMLLCDIDGKNIEHLHKAMSGFSQQLQQLSSALPLHTLPDVSAQKAACLEITRLAHELESLRAQLGWHLMGH